MASTALSTMPEERKMDTQIEINAAEIQKQAESNQLWETKAAQGIQIHRALERLEQARATISGPFVEQIRKASEQMKAETAFIEEQIFTLESELRLAKVALETNWGTRPKTILNENCRLLRRDYKKVELCDKEALISALTTIGKLTEAVKTWDDKLLLKLLEAEVIPEKAAKLIIKPTISISLNDEPEPESVMLDN